MVAILHADGTECHHTGDARATIHDPRGPLCPAGIRVTHVRVNGQTITVSQVAEAFGRLGEIMGQFFIDLAAVFENIGATLAPVLKILEEGRDDAIAP